jgi:hypothetical protein
MVKSLLRKFIGREAKEQAKAAIRLLEYICALDNRIWTGDRGLYENIISISMVKNGSGAAGP